VYIIVLEREGETGTMADELAAAIAALLEETQTAHAVHEAETLGSYDEQWPAWFADYLLEHGLPALLPHAIAGDGSRDRLSTRLLDLQAAFERDEPGGDWATYYAESLAAEERDRASHAMGESSNTGV
jgi:hypothetical protein